jgi:hypothetical protein
MQKLLLRTALVLCSLGVIAFADNDLKKACALAVVVLAVASVMRSA